ncbi:MAG: flagellar biosynthesis protein FlhB [Rhodospirillaceae bacterium]|jgi:flagellar biosynthesis protein FlhB|nr:flagellar biosynthesis protein FlhB [Rhodospirillaceae bacterium]
MSSDDPSQKTEEPTPRKLSQAREEGQVQQSKEIINFVLLLGGGISTAFFAPFLGRKMVEGLSFYVTKPDAIVFDGANIGLVMLDSLITVAIGLAPIPLLGMVLVLAALLGQVGFMLSAKPLMPKPDKISPISGAKRMFSLKSIVELLKGILKMTVVGSVAYAVLAPELDRAEAMMQMSIPEIMDQAWFIAIKLFIGVVAVLAVIAAGDYFYQKYEFMKQMRMTPQEVKDEFKESEGDPMVKGRLKQIRLERARARMMAAVPEADVVVTNPTHYAIALKYEGEIMAAPRLVAKGIDDVAMRIREVANENDVPIVENPPLARVLFATVELDQEIPPEHYKAVAEIIRYVYELKNKVLG